MNLSFRQWLRTKAKPDSDKGHLAMSILLNQDLKGKKLTTESVRNHFNNDGNGAVDLESAKALTLIDELTKEYIADKTAQLELPV